MPDGLTHAGDSQVSSAKRQRSQSKVASISSGGQHPRERTRAWHRRTTLGIGDVSTLPRPCKSSPRHCPRSRFSQPCFVSSKPVLGTRSDLRGT